MSNALAAHIHHMDKQYGPARTIWAHCPEPAPFIADSIVQRFFRSLDEVRAAKLTSGFVAPGVAWFINSREVAGRSSDERLNLNRALCARTLEPWKGCE